MLGVPRLMAVVGEHEDGDTLKEFILDDRAAFTGPDWDQEDDITMVTLQRTKSYGVTEVASRSTSRANEANSDNGNDWRTLAEFTLPSERGNERLAMEQVAAAVRPLKLPAKSLEQLKAAAAEATMNSMEQGNHS